MSTRLVPPDLGSLDDEPTEPTPEVRPSLRTAPRRAELPKLEALVQPGFVTEMPIPLVADPGDVSEVLTIEVPRRLKRALLAEVAARKDDPIRRNVASMKSVILEALRSYGFAELIRDDDVQVQAGIFMKRQAAQLRRR